VKQREMVASLAVAPRLLYWTQACVDRNQWARTSSYIRGRNANGRGLIPVRADGTQLGADGTPMGTDGWQWVRTTNNMAWTVHDRRGRPIIGADGSQWARATLQGADKRPCVTAYSVGTDTFPPGADGFCLMK
jgi:hypothetical protein